MKKILAVLLLPSILVISNIAVAAEDYSASIDNFTQAEQPHPFLKSAYKYALFPLIGKGGLALVRPMGSW